MTSAQTYITSVQTTTGYGRYVPVTTGGKIFTVAYALVGIPAFMWYIVKLGSLFRVIVMKLFSCFLFCLWYVFISSYRKRKKERKKLFDTLLFIYSHT